GPGAEPPGASASIPGDAGARAAAQLRFGCRQPGGCALLAAALTTDAGVSHSFAALLRRDDCSLEAPPASLPHRPSPTGTGRPPAFFCVSLPQGVAFSHADPPPIHPSPPDPGSRPGRAATGRRGRY